MTWNHFTITKNSSTASIEWWLVSNSSYRQDRIKKNKNGTFLKILTGKKIQNCVPKESFTVFQKGTELVFYTKISSLFLSTDVLSLTSCSISWKIVLKEEFCPFLVFCGELFPIVLIWTRAHSISINFTWFEIILLCQKTVLLPPSSCGWSQIQATDKTE